MFDHYDWLVSKGVQLPSSVEMIGLLQATQAANTRNLMVKQGWIAVQSPGRWHIKDLRSQSRIVEDAILTRAVNVQPKDWPIELFVVDSGEFVRVDKEDVESGDLGTMQMNVLSYIHKKHGFTKEALLRMDENIITIKHVIRLSNGEEQDWMVVDAYDIEKNKDLSMKMNLALMEAGLTRNNGEFYHKRLNSADPNAEYQASVDKATRALQGMVDPAVKVIPEKEFGRDDRSVIYIQTPKESSDFF
jgi:hypothetical protein